VRCAIVALVSVVFAGSLACAQPVEGRLKTIQETATLRIAYRTDSRPFSFVEGQGRPIGYTIELCERIAERAWHRTTRVAPRAMLSDSTGCHE
jgi:glutamate/aspartate transport system substrate-binding protein